jgi:hypothetical protein
MLADLVDLGTQFHALLSLSLPWMAAESKSFVALLECVPFLRELRFTVRPSHRAIIMDRPIPGHVLQNLSVLEAPAPALPLLLENKRLRELSCATVRDDGNLPTDIITVFDALPAETLSKLEKLTLDMKCLSDELLDCLVRRVPHISVLSLDVRGIAWGPTPGSLEPHTTKVT